MATRNDEVSGDADVCSLAWRAASDEGRFPEHYWISSAAVTSDMKPLDYSAQNAGPRTMNRPGVVCAEVLATAY
jgi:hypothetical protein